MLIIYPIVVKGRKEVNAMYGNKECCHEGQGRGMWEHEHQQQRGTGCCGEEGHEHGVGFRHRFMDDLFPSRERLQKTLEWLKDEKAALEKKIRDIEDLLKGAQS